MSEAKNPFQRAVRHKARARIGIAGPSGSGKSLTSLLIAKGMCGGTMTRPDGSRLVALIDSEPGASEWYAGDFEFDNLTPDSNDPVTWIHFMDLAAENGYEVLILDSASAPWSGRGGLLEFVDKQKVATGPGTNRHQLSPWTKATPKQNAFIEAMRRSPCHVIATLRTKTEWLIGEGGKPKKIGLGYVQRPEIEYEFDLVFDIDVTHVLTVSNRRGFAILDGYEVERPGMELGEQLRKYLEEGSGDARPAPPPPPPKAAPAPVTEETPKTRGAGPKATTKAKPEVSYESDDQVRHVAEILALVEDYGYERVANDGDAPVVLLPGEAVKVCSPGDEINPDLPGYEVNLAALPIASRLALRKYLEADLLTMLRANVRELTIDLYDIDYAKQPGGIVYPENVWTALNAQPRKLDPGTLDEIRSRRLMKVLRAIAAEREKKSASATPDQAIQETAF
jgi:hypothetical protein